MNSHAQRWVVYSLVMGLLVAGLVFPQNSALLARLHPHEKRAEAKCPSAEKPAQPAPQNAKDPLKVLLRGIIL